MIVNALADRPLPVYGRGLNVRDWLYVGDHCRAIDLVVNHGRIGEVYNIGGHNEMRNIDIVRLICRKLGKPERLITYVADRQGHDLRYAIDPTKIHAGARLAAGDALCRRHWPDDRLVSRQPSLVGGDPQRGLPHRL